MILPRAKAELMCAMGLLKIVCAHCHHPYTQSLRAFVCAKCTPGHFQDADKLLLDGVELGFGHARAIARDHNHLVATALVLVHKVAHRLVVLLVSHTFTDNLHRMFGPA